MALLPSRLSEKDQACVQTILLTYFSKWGEILIFFSFLFTQSTEAIQPSQKI